MSPKTGRPKENNPNAINLTVRINKELSQKLTIYCEEKNVTKGEMVRKGLEFVLDIKK